MLGSYGTKHRTLLGPLSVLRLENFSPGAGGRGRYWSTIGPMNIDFGVWDHFERRSGAPVYQQYAEKIEFVREAERLGFGQYHIAEHHLTPLDLAPSPSVFLAALAQATSRIRLGTGVYCLPLYHPVRLVQELCMLDNIAEGRLDIGVGRGIRATE